MLNRKEVEKMFPIGFCSETNEWGFIPLKECTYKSERAAKLARAKYMKVVEAQLSEKEHEERRAQGYQE